MSGRFARSSGIVVLVALCAMTFQAAATDLSGSVTGSVSDGSKTLLYRLFEPKIADGQKAPLVLFLHGMGERGADNVAQTTWMSGLLDHTQSGQYASYVLAPQIDTQSWFQSWTSTPTEAMSLTIKALQKVINTENIDTSRIYVTGVSMGGMGAWDILEREPKLFAAAVPMSGGGDVNSAAAIKDVPVWAFHGSNDPLVPVSATRAMIAALKDAGGSPKYTEVEGGGHVIWDPIYADAGDTLYPWLFSQHLGDAVAASPTPVADPVVSASDPDAIVPVFGSIPEPGTIALITLTAAALFTRRKRPTVAKTH
jgi:predicted peptidase